MVKFVHEQLLGAVAASGESPLWQVRRDTVRDYEEC